MCCSFLIWTRSAWFLLVSQGELWRIYIVKRGYTREPERRLFLSRPHHVLQTTSLCVKKVSHSNTRGTVRALFFPAQIYCCTIVYISNILWRLKVKSFKTPTVKKKLSSVLFILTANEHILTEFWLQIVEVAITSVGMSVQWLTTDYVHYFTI
jgi:hypothetical protein